MKDKARPATAFLEQSDPDLSDTALLAQVARRNENAFAMLVQRYRDRFYRVAQRMLRDADDADDAVQLAFFRVFLRADAYRNEWKGSTWLYRVLINTCVDAYRKRKRAEEPGDGPQPSSGTDRAIERLDLASALDKLPVEARAVFLLCYSEELSYREIARARGITVNTVKTQLRRAKQLMRRHLKEAQR